MHDDESDEYETEIGMNRVPDVQDGQGGERASSRQQESEMYKSAREDTTRRVAGCSGFDVSARHWSTIPIAQVCTRH